MKLFLSSVSIQPNTRQVFIDLVSKKARDIRVALIENGADTYPDDHREWVVQARSLIEATVGVVEVFDLRNYNSAQQIEEVLRGYDVIWVGGGNVFYLRYISRKSGFDIAIKNLVRNGVVYGGDSAGAIIAGPTIDGFQPADTPEDSPEIILEGFGLTGIVPIPHYDNEKYGPIMVEIEKKIQQSNYPTTAITDGQAIVVNNTNIFVE